MAPLSVLLAGLLAAAPTSTDADFLRTYAQTRRFMAGRPAGAKPSPDGKTVYFLRAAPNERVQSLYAFDVASGQVRELLTAQALLQGAAESLSAAERARLERQRITARGFTSFELSDDGARLLASLSGRPYVVELATGKVTAVATQDAAVLDPSFSPDGKQVAFVRDNDVHVTELASNRMRQVTRGGTDLRPHGLAEFAAQEEMGRYRGYWWSPDSKWLAYQESDLSKVERFSIADPLHPENPAETTFYPRAGRENARVRLGIVSARGGPTVWVKWDAEQYPYLAMVVWPKTGEGSGLLNLLVQNRAQTEEKLLAVDPRTGATRELLVEKDEQWLNLEPKAPLWIEQATATGKGGAGFFWVTERDSRGVDAGPQVELRDAKGALLGTWVKPEAGFAALVGFSAAQRTLYFLGSPRPFETHLFRVREGGVPERVETGEKDSASESAVLATRAPVLVVTSSALSHLPRTVVLNERGQLAGTLPSLAVEPAPSAVELTKVGAEPGFWTALLRPRAFQKGKKLPVILSVYGGPGHTEVGVAMGRYLLDQWLADQGFLVVKVDGRGTPRRGRDWERAIRGDFSQVILDDQLAALKALAAKVPELDLSRVGVYGWSFGGYLSALAVLKRSDAFKAAFAGAPVVDWRDYDTHYTERYLGLPEANAAGYQASSLLTYADKLGSKLLVAHGTADDNVYFFHSLKLSDALFRAGKPHQLLPLSNFTHAVPEPLATERLWQRMAQFFKEAL